MKQAKLLGVAIMATLSLTGILATTASAEVTLPSVLPVATAAEPILVPFTSLESKFATNAIATITSSKDEGTLDFTSTKLGTFNILFLESKDPTGAKCTGSGQSTAGLIAVSGTFHLRDYDEATQLKVAAAVLVQEVKFECTDGVKGAVRGCVAGAITPENTLTTNFTISFKRNGSLFDNLIITILNEANTAKEACQLFASSNGGVSFELAYEATEELTLPAKHDPAGTEVQVLIMRL
jgi:hypothetical protein